MNSLCSLSSNLLTENLTGLACEGVRKQYSHHVFTELHSITQFI